LLVIPLFFVATLSTLILAAPWAAEGWGASPAFDPDDLNHWRVTRTEDGQHLLAAQRTLVEEIVEANERAALRKFLYGMDLPDSINIANIHIERIDGSERLPFDEEAAA
jgi:hypothetical protein